MSAEKLCLKFVRKVKTYGHYKTISEWFQAWQLPMPEHPLISVVKTDTTTMMCSGDKVTCFCDFYCIAIKRVTGAENLKLKYGQQSYDFNEEIMAFASPGQVISLAVEKDVEIKQWGWHLGQRKNIYQWPFHERDCRPLNSPYYSPKICGKLNILVQSGKEKSL